MHEGSQSVEPKGKLNDNKKRELENILRAKIGDSPGIEGVATWKLGKPRKVFDKNSFREAEPEMYHKFLIEQPGIRTLRVKVK